MLSPKNINRKMFVLFAVFSMFFLLQLTGCSESKVETATLVFSSSVDLVAMKNETSRKQKALPHGFEVVSLTSIEIAVSDKKGNFSVVEIITEGNNSVSFSVPSKTDLIITGRAFEGEILRYHGGAAVAPIASGTTQSVSFLMYGLDGDPILVDVGLSNKPADGESTGSSLSLSQNYVLFTSAATNLIENDDNNAVDLFLRDLSSNKIININSSSAGELANNPDAGLLSKTAISADGRFVVFASTSSNLIIGDRNGVSDVFLKDTLTGEIERISLAVNGKEVALPSYQTDISSDGQTILLYSEADLLINERAGLYFYDRLSRTIEGSVDDAQNPRLSGDGKYVVYVEKSTENLMLFNSVSGLKTVILDASAIEGDTLDADPVYEYEISRDGSLVVLVANKNFDGVSENHVYVYKKENDTFTLVSDSDEGPLALSDNELRSPSMSSGGRYVIFRFNKIIYIKDMLNDQLEAIASGINPFLSLDGQRLGYTDVSGRVLLLNNPLRGVVNSSPIALLEKINNVTINRDVETGRYVVAWSPVEAGSYYRIYVSTNEGVLPENFYSHDNGIQLETVNDQYLLPSVFNSGDTLYVVVTVVNDSGESAPSDEVFFAIPADDVFTLNYIAGSGGSVSGVLSQTVSYGASGAMVTAAPSVGYSFVGWSDSVTSASRVDSNAVSNLNVTANFKVNSFELNYSAGVGGSIDGIASQAVNYGESGSLVTAVANKGYVFSGWSDSTEVTSRTDRNVVSNLLFTAQFSIITYSVSVKVGAGGTVSPSLNQQVDYGSVQQFMISPSLTAKVDAVKGCGGILSGFFYTTAPVVNDCTVVVAFAVNARPSISTDRWFADENTIDGIGIVASDPDEDPLSYRISGGSDQLFFTISSAGFLSFIKPPNYESPQDSNSDNRYVVQLIVNDGTIDSFARNVTVTVANVVESGLLLNDSGVTGCTDTKSLLTCPQKGLEGQDAEFGRDYRINDKSDGNAGFSFTKIDSKGNKLLSTAKTWSCVLDNVTGNMWEVKDANTQEIRSAALKYNWNDANGFAKIVNSIGLCGFTDWKLPTVTQLTSIVDYSQRDPAIDLNYFPNTYIGYPSYFWSLMQRFDPAYSGITSAWVVQFTTGSSTYFPQVDTQFVRLVRGD